MVVGRFQRPLRGVGVQEIPYVRLDRRSHITSGCNFPAGAVVLYLLEPGMIVGALIDCRRVVVVVEVTGRVATAMCKLFCEDERVEF